MLAAAAVAATRAREPDVVLLDVHLPGGGRAVLDAVLATRRRRWTRSWTSSPSGSGRCCA